MREGTGSGSEHRSHLIWLMLQRDLLTVQWAREGGGDWSGGSMGGAGRERLSDT